MIILTRIDDINIAVNEDYIELITEAPDTIITMHNGKSYAVKEDIESIISAIKKFKIDCCQVN